MPYNTKEKQSAYSKKYRMRPNVIIKRVKEHIEYLNKQGVRERKSYLAKIRGFERKILVIGIYSKFRFRCKCCSENNIGFLSIDHPNNDGAKERKRLKMGNGGLQFYSWLIKNNFPLGYDVLCMNCNFGKEKNGRICPHKTKRYFSVNIKHLEIIHERIKT